MVPPKKPEWFEMTEGENNPRPNRGKKVLKVVALTAPLLIVAGGIVVAQTGNSGPADAVNAGPTETIAPAEPAPSVAPSQPAPTVANPNTKSNFVKKPSIANPPRGRGDDDGEREHEGREHHGEEEDDD